MSDSDYGGQAECAVMDGSMNYGEEAEEESNDDDMDLFGGMQKQQR